MEGVIAFADEFGNNSFDFATQGSHFIIASVITSISDLHSFNEELDNIRAKYFQKGEIKSQKVGPNHNRRLKILRAIRAVDFTIYAVVVDKRKLSGEGFNYKRSFYKYLNGHLYKELYRTFPQLDLKVDEHGGNDFMRSFKKYVEKNHVRTLFTGSEFNIKKSHNDLGVQLSDFVAGTLGYVFDETKKSSYSEKFYDFLREKLVSVNRFPRELDVKFFHGDEVFTEYDKTIASLSLNRIANYLDEARGGNIKELDRIKFLKLLLLFHQSNHPQKYTTANEFIQHLNVGRAKKISKELFGANIVAPLRDSGILIASSRGGYKIPTTTIDLKRFINHGKKIIIPMLRRISECRNATLLATTNQFDILSEPEFKKLRKLVESLD